ncbi:MAG TPA: hypothetical protein K8V90_02710 [Romboutsia timonensis]|uniref:Uncharacterized protein n=1 Tax=Romboutsia timonensis TaxID=1776391 RepID=A0A921SZG8_9FIRM|nr:hypothetical protein [uncultured Romboutsia sp.]HJG95995.1 hypothetical protein [Romboutsia timonensis]
MNLLPIPWIKQKLEKIYNVNLYGKLYLMFNDIVNDYNIDTNTLKTLINSYNILVNESHPLYLYLPIELNYNVYKLMISFKYLYHDNIYIVLCGYKDNYPNLNELDCLANLCSKYENLDSIVSYACLIDSNKIYKIINALLDTQQIYINPLSSCSISGIVLNYHINQLNPNNVTHISFIDLMYFSYNDISINYYLNELSNNNNFNYN